MSVNRVAPERWAILTGEYPPQPGGVSDYTRLVAEALAATGDEVHVWAPPTASAEIPGAAAVHRLPDHYGPRSLAQLASDLSRFPRPRRLLVQYTPAAFGWNGLNLPFALWLYSQRRVEAIDVLFHEVIFPFRRWQPWKHRLLAAVTRLTASLAARAARHIYISIPAWQAYLPVARPARRLPIWLPIPSTLPTRPPEGRTAVRKRLGVDAEDILIGHFGTYGPLIAGELGALLPTLLAGHPRRRTLLLGRGGEHFAGSLREAHPELHGRLVAPGAASAEWVAACLAACDVLVQPYPDGVSSRRTSVMVGLGLGLPIVTTEGFLSESVWRQTGAVALAPAGSIREMATIAELLLSDPARRAALGVRAACVYREFFALEKTITRLRT